MCHAEGGEILPFLMHAQMALEIRLLREASLADIALVRFFPSVDPDVSHQIRPLFESLIAMLAGKNPVLNIRRTSYTCNRHLLMT